MLGYLIGLLIGLAGATLKRSGGPISRDLMSIYTTAVRAIPELVLILLAYFAMPELLSQIGRTLGYGRIEVNGFIAGVLVIGFVQG